tara:strand:- start:914 stop:1057 length:144 start_codon:yes stop_codon:yes gene_type:complete
MDLLATIEFWAVGPGRACRAGVLAEAPPVLQMVFHVEHRFLPGARRK